MKSQKPIVIVGGGHNGLTAAALLARAGRRTILCEARSVLGGIAASEEFYPGFWTTGLWHSSGRVRQSIVKELALAAHGFSLEKQATPVFIPQVDGPGLVHHRDPASASTELRVHSAKDAASYGAWRHGLKAYTKALDRHLDRSPADPNAKTLRGLFELARAGLSLRLLGSRLRTELSRIVPMSAAGWLGEAFESELLQCALAAPSLLGNWCGPRSPGTAALALVDACTTGRDVRGGPAALVGCLERAARHHGAELRIDAPVARIQVEQGSVVAVVLESGETIATDAVLCACDPKHALLKLLQPDILDSDLTQRLQNFRTRGTTAKVHLALSGLPSCTGRPGVAFEKIQTGETIDELERAFAPVKTGAIPTDPQLDIRFPSITDPELAPPGKHVASILVHFVPQAHSEGWGPAQKKELQESVLRKLHTVMPSIGGLIDGVETLTPSEIEERYGLTGEHVFDGEHALDQLLFMRPDPTCARHATPVAGLYLAASGSHPGGGITCGPGALGAAAALKRSR